MTFTGQVVDGKVVLPSPLPLPNGTTVTVEPVALGVANSPSSSDRPPTKFEHYRDAIGTVELPTDAATQHDHYLYGTPKR